MDHDTSDENGDVKKMTFICKIPLNKLERVPEKKNSDNFSSKNGLQDSDEIDFENIPLSKILRYIEGVNCKRSSMREAVIKKNFVRKIKASDVYSTSNSFSAAIKVTELENKDVNEYNGELQLHGTSIAKKPKHGDFSRKRENQRKLHLDSEIKKLRKYVQSCYTAMESVQLYTDMRLKHYASISDSSCMEGNKLNHNSRKRKCIKDQSFDEVYDEIKAPESEKPSAEDVVNSLWTCEVDGIKLFFKKINEDNLL